MEQIQSYLEPSKLKQFLEQAYLLALEIGPNLIKAALIFFVGMYVVRFINRIVKRFFDR